MRRLPTQNLSDGRLPLWRRGRAWWGRYRFVIEWSLLQKSSSVGVSIGWLCFSLRLPPLCSIYFCPTDRPGIGRRELDIYWHGGCLWISHPFEREGGIERRSSDPWWKKVICLHVVDWLIGKPKYESVAGSPTEVFVPMPEGSYRAIATPQRQTWKRRWYWPSKVVESVWLEIPGGISHSGKGENSWDCGDDGLCGIGGDTTEGAISNAVRSVLRNRRRYGHDSRGTGRAPALVLNREIRA